MNTYKPGKGVPTIIIVFLLFCLTSASLMSQTDNRAVTSSKQATVTVDWSNTKKLTYSLSTISSENVSLKAIVKNLNLRYYKIMTSVVVEQIPANESLQALFGNASQLKPINTGIDTLPADVEFENAYTTFVKTNMGDYKIDSALDTTELETELEAVRKSNNPSVSAKHKDLKEKLDSLKDTISIIKKGTIIEPAAAGPGTKLTLTITAVLKNENEKPKNNKDDQQDAEPYPAPEQLKRTVVLSVISRSRFTLHAGFAAGNPIKTEVTELKRKLNGSDTEVDVFNIVESEDIEPVVIGFVSYELKTFGDNNENGWLVTLGTDGEDAFNRVYAGISFRWKEAILSAGPLFFKYTKGLDVIEESEDAKLYRNKREAWKLTAFVALTYRF